MSNRINAVNANRLFILCSVGSYAMTFFVSFFIRDTMVLQAIQELMILLPVVLYVLLQKKNLFAYIGVRHVKLPQWGIIVLIAICTDKISQLLNLLSQLFVKNEVGSYMADLLVKYPFAIMFFVVAVMPAICEEVAYRGVIYQGYRKSSRMLAIILSSFLFGLMHMDANQFFYAVVIGILMALTNEAVGSILPSMLIHLYINGKSTVLLYTVIHFFRTYRAQYLAAELAGNVTKMEELKTLLPGIPIDREEGLSEYLFAPVDVKSQLLSVLPGALIAMVAVVFLLQLLVHVSGRKEKFRQILQKEKVSFLSPTLFIGVILCVVTMFLPRA